LVKCTHFTLTAKAAPVTVNYAGYPGRLDWWEIEGARGPSMTTTLLVGRRYVMQADYTAGLNDSSTSLSPPGAGVVTAMRRTPAVAIATGERPGMRRVLPMALV
jgi:hypothetical protein